MRIGIASDHGGFAIKGELIFKLRVAGHRIIDFGPDHLDESDDYPDFVIPLADAVATDWADRGIVLCTSGAGASICANKSLVLALRSSPGALPPARALRMIT